MQVHIYIKFTHISHTTLSSYNGYSISCMHLTARPTSVTDDYTQALMLRPILYRRMTEKSK